MEVLTGMFLKLFTDRVYVSVHQFSPQITKTEEPSEPESGTAGINYSLS